MTTKCMTDQVNMAMFDTRACAVRCLSAFPKLLNDQTILKSSNVLMIYYAQKITSWLEDTDAVFTTVDAKQNLSG